jgi:hypothetical protein
VEHESAVLDLKPSKNLGGLVRYLDPIDHLAILTAEEAQARVNPHLRAILS